MTLLLIYIYIPTFIHVVRVKIYITELVQWAKIKGGNIKNNDKKDRKDI
jgi:hypothetical protein